MAVLSAVFGLPAASYSSATRRSAKPRAGISDVVFGNVTLDDETIGLVPIVGDMEAGKRVQTFQWTL